MLREAKYLKLFQRLGDRLNEFYTLYEDCILVQRVPLEELKTESGIILQSVESKRTSNIVQDERPVYVQVLSVGKPFTDESGVECEPPVAVGTLLQVSIPSVKWKTDFFGLVSTEGEEIGLMRYSGNLQESVPSVGAYNTGLELIRQASKEVGDE